MARELALPTQKAKGWEFTDLSDLDLDAYDPDEGSIEGLLPGVDSAAGPPVVMPLEEAAGRLGDLVQERFGSLISVGDDPFVARNEANWRSGVLVYVPRGQRLAEPLRLSVLQDGDGGALDWRVLIVLEEGAEAEVWERYASDDDADHAVDFGEETIAGN